MAVSNKGLIPGITLILLGIIFLLPNFTMLRGRDLWPVFVLGPGVALYIGFLRDRASYGLLMPATVLTVVGLMFFYCIFEGWFMMRTIWPFFIIAPGLGFLLMYVFGRKESALLIAGGILSAVGLIFLVGVMENEYLLPLILIVIGVILLLNTRRGGPAA